MEGYVIQGRIKKTTSALKRWLAKRLTRISFWLESEDHSRGMKSKFVDLAPTDEADKAGVYSEAILFATNNEKVSNIALTGPYGSGKSSIIRSFLRKYQRPALHISLASFVSGADTGDEKVSRQEIERSILQQMLYGADANKLPLSRFKRIQSPGFGAIFKSLYIMLGFLALWFVFHQREDIIDGSFFHPLALSNGVNLGIFGFSVMFLWVTVHHFYIKSFGLSLKSISLKDVEIKPAHDDQTSILNRHLDEIVYFFQSTSYDLVIIEDLDRFNDADIFVTLREINSLVNENSGVKRTIRFLYALRDDMFINTDRTKFFEFIIPVIPIINTSNSIDMVLAQGRRLELDGRLDRQFLRDVSRYLNDLRLIQNIFNEYALYVANLETDGENLLDANKILAVLIYKNVYPRDFEQLHRGTGTFAGLLNRQDEFIEYRESTYRAEIMELEDQLEVAERQTPLDLLELRQIYAMALIEKSPANVVSVRYEHKPWIAFPQVVRSDEFDQLLEARQVTVRDVNGRVHMIDVSKLQSEGDPQKSYQQRKTEIESKATDNKKKILRRINELRSKIATLRTISLSELLRSNDDQIRDLFKDFGENGQLARFLILEGYLDDTYYQYTSLFHAGRLSPNDNKFLIKIRAFITPEPVFPIDNPKEVIAAMRDEDFRQSYILNIKLVDTILSDKSRYLDKNQKLFEFISAEFERCEAFFDAYYSSGHYVVELLSGLARNWKYLTQKAITSPNNISHITQLVSHLPESLLGTLSRDYDDLPKFVSDNLPAILASAPEIAPERVKCLNFEIKDLAAIKEHSEIVRFMFNEGFFELTIANLEYVYQSIMGESNLEPLRERNFTTIRATNNDALMKRIERDFAIYLSDVLLGLQENTKEDSPAILEVLQHDTLNPDDIRKFIERQTTLLPNLEDVPKRLHVMLFELGVIEPTWRNCLTFMEDEVFEADSLVGYLDRDCVRAAILEHSISSDEDSRKLRQFLINAGSLSDAAYRDYAHALPSSFKRPPEGLEPTKLRILIDEGKIKFSKESLDAFADHRDLQVRLVAANIEPYLADPDNFALDDSFRAELLRSEIDHVAKSRIVELMDLRELVGHPELSALIGPIINNTDAKISNLDGDSAQTLIIHSKPIETQISLFNKYHDLLTNDEVHHVLDNLQKPFCEIKTGHNRPRLKKSSENLDLVRWLDSRNIISSWSEDRFFTDDIRVNLFRRG